MYFGAALRMATGYDNKGKPRRGFLEEAFSLPFAGKKGKLPDRIAMLGIPEEELSESVILAVSALFEKMDDMSIEMKQSKEQLKELESLVDVDTLAPIPNRRAFMRRLQWVISMLERYDHPSSIAYFDLNGFKQINDTYGHAAGDMAIRHVAEILSSTKRESDFLARLGGDEFAVILYFADAKAAEKRAREIAEKIATTPFRFNGHPLHVTASIGFHFIRKGETAEEALHAADQSMFSDKRSRVRDASAINA
jgi:diguanylate cyclase (GGDEF)-like protein